MAEKNKKYMNFNEIKDEIFRFFFKWESLNLDIDKPFIIYLAPLAFGIEIMEWVFFISFWIFTIGIGVVGPIVMFFIGEIPIYLIPFVAIISFIMNWLFFYVWGWFCLGSNLPKRVNVNENGAEIEYPIKYFNIKIPRERLVIKNSIFFGTPIMKIKDRKKLKGIWLNEYMYRILEGTKENIQ